VSQNNAQLKIRAADVRLTGRDRADLYRLWHANLEQPDPQEHLELAEWCIKNRLFSEAKAELHSAAQAEPTHPKIPLLERRLELAARPPAAKPATTAPKPAAATPSLTNDDLDKLVRSLPTGTVETFANTVQPLLLNHCSTAGCHGPQSQTSLRLLRIPPARVTGRRLTQRNLHAALSAVNRDIPEESPLLLVPTQPHATLKAAVFTNREAAQYKQLVDWVVRVSGSPPVAKSNQPATLTEPASPLLQKVERRERLDHSDPEAAETAEDSAEQRSAVEAADKHEADVDEPHAAPSTPSATGAKQKSQYVPRPKLQRGAKRDEFTPKDEFDPEIFNRRYFGK
jgi:hypothetical protein